MPVVTFQSPENVEWQAINTLPKRSPGSVHVWLIRIPDHLHLTTGFTDYLSAEEQERGAKYRDENDRARFLISRLALRMLLGKYMAIAPKDVELIFSPGKKPFLKNSGIPAVCYNVSHSGESIVIAITETTVGVDIEQPETRIVINDVMAECFSDKEIEFVIRSKDPESAFYVLWTRKEALVKATEKGIDNDLARIPSMDGSHSISTAITGSQQDWRVNSFYSEQLTGSIACQPDSQPPQFFDAAYLLRNH